MASKFCSSCKWWEGKIFTRVDQHFGICCHPVASTMMITDTATKINEGTVAYTDKNFGCPYIENTTSFLIDIQKTIHHEQM